MNIAEILKYCPKGTKLYSLVDGEVTLKKVTRIGSCPILVEMNDGTIKYYSKDGLHFTNTHDGECILFPSKTQRDWSKFKLPVKRGDIMMKYNGTSPFISNGVITEYGGFEYICGVSFLFDDLRISHLSGLSTIWTDEFCIPASEEVKKKLFDKIEEAGYRWNANTLELEKIEHKFKEGDVIIDKKGSIFLISRILDGGSTLEMAAVLNKEGLIINPNVWQNPYDKSIASKEDRNKLFSVITKESYRYDKELHTLIKQDFKPFDKVLVRDSENEEWSINIFSYYDEENKNYPYVCLCNRYNKCIPYENNEYLVGKTGNIH